MCFWVKVALRTLAGYFYRENHNMTEATGKGNCMIGRKKTFIKLPAIACLLGLLGVLSCLPFAYAQQSTNEEEGGGTRHI